MYVFQSVSQISFKIWLVFWHMKTLIYLEQCHYNLFQICFKKSSFKDIMRYITVCQQLIYSFIYFVYSWRRSRCKKRVLPQGYRRWKSTFWQRSQWRGWHFPTSIKEVSAKTFKVLGLVEKQYWIFCKIQFNMLLVESTRKKVLDTK